jgi:hypothetical protein
MPVRERQVAFPAYFFLAFSLAATLLWPFRGEILAPYLAWSPWLGINCMGMLALSLARFRGVVHPIPGLELVVFLQPVAFRFVTDLLWPQLEHRALDEFLLAFDRTFGYLELSAGRLFLSVPVTNVVCRSAYFSLLAVMPLLYLALPTDSVRKKFVYAVILVDLVILPMYMICPGAGPLYLLKGEFPWRALDTLPQVRWLPHVPLNASPSGHVAWVLLMFWFAGQYCKKPVRILVGVFAALTCAGTLGMGEHYVIDLVLAVPFARCIWALVHRQWKTAAIATVVVLIWLVAFRLGWTVGIPLALALVLTIVTIAPFAMGRGEAPAARQEAEAGRLELPEQLRAAQ